MLLFVVCNNSTISILFDFINTWVWGGGYGGEQQTVEFTLNEQHSSHPSLSQDQALIFNSLEPVFKATATVATTLHSEPV